MAITVDATTKQDSSGYVNSLTFSHTTAGSNRGLVVGIACRTGVADISGVTYNAVSLTSEVNSENTNVCGVTTWSLIAPASGANNVVVSLGGFKLLTVVAVSFDGADQSNLVEATNGSNNNYSAAPSNAISTVTYGAMVIDFINLQSARTVTVGAGQTERSNTDHSDSNLGQFVVSTEPATTAGSVTMSHSWTGDDNWSHALLAIRAATQDLGYTSIGGLGSFKQDDVQGAEFTAPADGLITGMYIHIRSNWTAGEKVKGVMYDYSGNFIAETVERSDGGSGWEFFYFTTPEAVTSGTSYLIGEFTDSAVQFSYTTTGVAGLRSPVTNETGTYPTVLDPTGTVDGSYQFSIYAVFLEDASGTAYTTTLTEALVLVDTISLETSKTLTEALALVDAISNRVGKSFSEAIALVDSLANSTSKVLSESVTLVDDIANQISLSLGEAITLVDDVTSSIGKAFSEVVALVDTVTPTFTVVRTFTEAITLVDTINKSVSKTLGEVVTIVDNVLLTISSSRVFTEAIILVDDFAVVLSKTFQEVVSLADDIFSSASKLLSESLTLVDYLATSVQFSRAFSEAIVLVDNFARTLTINRTFTETISFIDSVISAATVKARKGITILTTAAGQTILRVKNIAKKILGSSRNDRSVL